MKQLVAVLAGLMCFGAGVRETDKPIRLIRAKVTAYCPCEKCCGEWAKLGPDRKVRCGHRASEENGVAADPTLLPYGTVLEIPGVGRRTVDDGGGKMRKSAKEGITHIDVRVVVRDPNGTVNLKDSHAQAKKWGVQWLDVKVLPKTERRSVE